MNTIQITEESAIIPLKRLNEYKDLEIQISRILNDETKFFSIITYNPGASQYIRYSVPSEWEVSQVFHEELKKMGNRHREELERIQRNSVRGMGFDEVDTVVKRESKKKYWSGWFIGMGIGMLIAAIVIRIFG